MLYLRKSFTTLFIVFISFVNAQAETIHFEPGIYENLLLAVSKNGVITGYTIVKSKVRALPKRVSFFFRVRLKREWQILSPGETNPLLA